MVTSDAIRKPLERHKLFLKFYSLLPKRLIVSGNNPTWGTLICLLWAHGLNSHAGCSHPFSLEGSLVFSSGQWQRTTARKSPHWRNTEMQKEVDISQCSRRAAQKRGWYISLVLRAREILFNILTWKPIVSEFQLVLASCSSKMLCWPFLSSV